MRHTWESLALSDPAFRRDALLAAKALARLADEDCGVTVTTRSLGDAMLGPAGRHDPGMSNPRDGWERAARRGLVALLDAGYLARLNRNAPRREPGRYLLVIPAPKLVDA